VSAETLNHAQSIVESNPPKLEGWGPTAPNFFIPLICAIHVA